MSHAPAARGATSQIGLGAVRFSVGAATTIAEIERVVADLRRVPDSSALSRGRRVRRIAAPASRQGRRNVDARAVTRSDASRARSKQAWSAALELVV